MAGDGVSPPFPREGWAGVGKSSRHILCPSGVDGSVRRRSDVTGEREANGHLHPPGSCNAPLTLIGVQTHPSHRTHSDRHELKCHTETV